MNKFISYCLCGFLACVSTLSALQYEAYVGPHFNYTHLKFNNPSDLEGYQGGVTGGITATCGRYAGNINFEGTWNAARITGAPCEQSQLSEYFLDLQLRKSFSCCQLCLTPYVGFGWDRFNNRQDPSGARLLYQYDKLFIPLGLYLSSAICKWEVAAQLEWRPDVYDNLRLIGLNLDPKWGYGWRIQLPLVKRFFCQRGSCCRVISLNIVPFFDWNRFGQISLVNSADAPLIIPRLTRWNTGLRLLLGYGF